ncbi:F0F1 ATP synthase subunit A [Mangrovicoccus ximenensis]|uniref:F0F1 ATP synthase subunit A n=1 Tax=Mangrovicoccus ximenensis TaxID=1911570 RepID=UPI001F32C4F8|nr:F0F1 ATP synthase subunit A [Mangrovicoccus ximenensis]
MLRARTELADILELIDRRLWLARLVMLWLGGMMALGLAPFKLPLVTVLALALALRLHARAPSRRRVQSVLELFLATLDGQIRATTGRDPAPFRALIGTIFLFVLAANWSGLVPGIEPPTAALETDAAAALIVFAATTGYGIRYRGLGGYLKTFAEPSWVMIPLNIIEQITRTVALIVRLFGNVMSGVFVIGVVLSLAGLFVPVPLMALDLLTGGVQAYIFAILATVFIGAAVGEPPARPAPSSEIQEETSP